MAEYLIEDSTLMSLANAIQRKAEKTEALTPEQMATEIQNIGTNAFALIKASCPEGYTCTCTDGIENLNAALLGGKWVFVVPSLGTWTVTATEGQETLSEAVEITTAGQMESVELFVDTGTYLYKIGEQATDLTGGWSKSGYSYGESGYSTYAPTFDDAGMHLKTNAAGTYSTISGTANAIDLTLAQTITVNVSAVTGTLYFICNTAKTVWDSGMKKMVKITKTGETVIDVSALSGAYYVALVVFGSDAGIHTATVTSVKIDEKEAFYLFRQGIGAVLPLKTARESNATVSITNSAIKVTSTGTTANYSLVETQEPIDLSNYSTMTLCVQSADVVYSGGGLYISKAAQSVDDDPSVTAKKALTTSTIPKIFTLSISTRTGEFYLGVHAAWEGNILTWYLT